MGVTYDDYLNAGTKRLMEFLSSSDIEQEEKEAIVSAFSGELTKNIGDIEKLPDYDFLIYSVSLKHVNEKILAILSNDDASYEEYEKGISLCEREKEMLALFATKNWPLPLLANVSPDQSEEIFKKRQETTSITRKILEEDRRIETLIHSAETNFSVKDCDEALELINELANDISISRQKRMALPRINNKDTRKAAKKVAGIRKIAEPKEALHKQMYEIDQQLYGIVSLPKIAPEQCQTIVKLCQQQSIYISECKKKQWPMPSIRYKVPDVVANQYKHYQIMHRLDQAIFSSRDRLSSRKKYKKFFANCDQQKNNIIICKNNGWPVPELSVANPESLSREIQEEKKRKDRRKKIKFYLTLTMLVIAAVIIAGYFIVQRFHRGKVQIPFDAAYVHGEDIELIYSELENAGFENIERKQDTSDWLEGGEVIGVSIDNQNDYDKGQYKKPDVSIVITYASNDRVYVTDILQNWKKTDYTAVMAKLEDAGFTNIDVQEVETSDKDKDQLVSGIMLNGAEYSNEQCYLPKNAPVVLSYYTLKIGIGNNSNEFIGQNYEDVVDDLKESGFANVQTEKINTGVAKGNTVVGVTVNNTDAYDSSQSFDPDVKIVVKFSSNDRVDATSIMENWSSEEYKSIQKKLEEKGFTNITVKEKLTDNKLQNLLVAGVNLNGDEFKSGDCFIQKDADIIIEYYVLKIVVGERASTFTKNEKGNYSEIKTMLESKGFTDIKVYRKNDLLNGWLTKEGSVDSISIDGNDDFSEEDAFAYNAPVVIVVHTFKNKGCEDITEIAE